MHLNIRKTVLVYIVSAVVISVWGEHIFQRLRINILLHVHIMLSMVYWIEVIVLLLVLILATVLLNCS